MAVDHRPYARRRVLTLAGAGVFAAALDPLGRARAQDAKLKIATIGAGEEGATLGTLFAERGHPVMFSSRNPGNLASIVAAAGPTAAAGTVAEAIAFADAVMIAVPYTALKQIGADFGPRLATKALVVDVSNPSAHRDGEEFVRAIEQEGGAGVVTAKLLPGARLVRAFNALGSPESSGATALTKAAQAGGGKVGVPISGDDPKAIALAEGLIRELGLEPVPIGGLPMGRYLVPRSVISGVHSPAELRAIAAKLS